MIANTLLQIFRLNFLSFLCPYRMEISPSLSLNLAADETFPGQVCMTYLTLRLSRSYYSEYHSSFSRPSASQAVLWPHHLLSESSSLLPRYSNPQMAQHVSCLQCNSFHQESENQ